MRELIQYNISGMNYGVLKEEVLSVEMNQIIHQLPLVPKCIAGMSVIKGNMYTLADLSACIGLSSITKKKDVQALLLSDQEEIAGFAIDGGSFQYNISDEEIFSLPMCLKTDIFDKCIVRNGEPIPLINIAALYHCAKLADYEPSIHELNSEDIPEIDISKVISYKNLECGGETFAFPAEITEDNSFTPGHVARIAMTPDYIEGILHYNNKLLPLIHLGSRMKLLNDTNGSQAVVTNINGGFSFLIDSLKGTMSIENSLVRPLPPLVQSNWMNNAIISENVIIPIIDPGALISSKSDESDEIPIPERYNPDETIISKFRNEEVEVLEFSFLDTRHGIPKLEIEDIIELRFYRNIPNVQSLVIGISEYKGELIPVLDLAMCFDRRSDVTSIWKMILIKNGDFRAFVLTERVFNYKKIPLRLQHELPIVLPHRILYGCYTDEVSDSIKLLFNIEALTVYFNKKIASEISKAFIKDIEKAQVKNASIVAKSNEEKILEESDEKESEASVEECLLIDQVELSKSVNQTKQVKEGENYIPYETAASSDELYHFIQDNVESANLELEKEKDISIESNEREVIETEEANEDQPYLFDESEIVEESEYKVADNKETLLEFDIEMDNSDMNKLDTDEEQTASIKTKNKILEDEKNSEIDSHNVTDFEKTSIDHVKSEKNAGENKNFERYILNEMGLIEDKNNTAEVSEKKDLKPVQEKKELIETEQEDLLTEGPATDFFKEQVPLMDEITITDLNKSGSTKVKGNYIFAITAVVFLSIVFIYYILNLRPDRGRIEREKTRLEEKREVENIDEIKLNNFLTDKTEIKTKKIIKENQENFFFEYKIYEVKKGDTLYEITESFTGDGFEYWDVAKHNQIKNPDLIYPKQKIKIKIITKNKK